MNIENMKLAIQILDKVIEENRLFDYTYYGTKGPCGTRACAAGWIALDERTDLTYEWHGECLFISYGHNDDIHALADWLDVPYTTVYRIFVAAYTYLPDLTEEDITAQHVKELLQNSLEGHLLLKEGS